MPALSPHARGTVVAAVAFDSQTDAVVRAATSLAQRFGLKVHLVSVVEPTLMNPWITLNATEMTYFPMYPDIDETARRNKLAKIKELAARLELPETPTYAVRYGVSTQAIIAEALSERANLIITGFNPESYRLTSAGVSTAIGLLHDAPLPVLAVCQGASPDFSKKSFKILIADDLSESTQEAVRKSYELASQLNHAVIKQTFIHGDFRELLRSRWDEFKAHLPGKDAEALTPDSLWESEYQDKLARCQAQGTPFRQKAEQAGAEIEMDVRTGRSVAETFHEVAQEFAPDLVAFGRHRFLRAKPFLIGRMPIRTMLQLQKAILIVPAAAELYAKLPFPAAP